jgi:hypothetical protein
MTVPLGYCTGGHRHVLAQPRWNAARVSAFDSLIEVHGRRGVNEDDVL